MRRQLDWIAATDKARAMTNDHLRGAIADIRRTLRFADLNDRVDGGNRGGYYRDESSVYHTELRRRGAVAC